MKLLCFLSVVIALHGAAEATAGNERRSTTLLTPDIADIVQKTVDSGGIPGLTLAFISKTGQAEFGAWGIKSENGSKMTTDVRRTFLRRF